MFERAISSSVSFLFFSMAVLIYLKLMMEDKDLESEYLTGK